MATAFEVWNPNEPVEIQACEAPPKKPEIPEPPPMSCLVGPEGQQTFPLPGTLEWCRCADQIEEWFSNVGNSVLDFLFGTVVGVEQEQSFVSSLLGVLPPVAAIRGIAEIAKSLVKQFQQELKAALDQIKAIATNAQFCAPAKLMGLSFAKTLVTLLRRTRFGTDAAVWLTIDIAVALEPLERVIDYLLHHVCPTEIPSIPESIELFIRGTIPLEQCRCMVLMRGGVWEVWQELIVARRNRPGVIDLYNLRNREIINDEVYDKQLRYLGFVDDNERAGIGTLRNNVPGPSDLVRFAVRHVFEPDLLERFRFNDERELGAFRLDAYHHTAGLDYPIFTGPLRAVVESVTGFNADQLAADYTNRGLPEPTWAHAYWWSHWIIPPQSWAAEARFRLNPARDTSLEPDEMKQLVFTPDDYDKLLRMNDYPPYFREKMFALSYRPPQMRFMRLLVDQGQMNEAQLQDQMNRLGMMPKVAEKFTQAIIRDVREKRDPARLITKGGTARAFRSIVKNYKLGTINRDRAYSLLDNLGVARWAIDVYLDTTDADLKADYVATAVKRIKQDYMQGATDLLTTRQLLARAGVVEARANEYIDLWAFERNLTFKMATTGELLRWYTEGIIDQPTLLLRLQNLGWIQPDLLAYLAEGDLRIQKRQAAIAAASLRSARANAALIEKLKRDSDRQSRELESELRRLTPVGRLIKWARQGSISEIYFENRLSAMGYPPDVIAEYWQEVIKDGPIPNKSGNGTVSGA